MEINNIVCNRCGEQLSIISTENKLASVEPCTNCLTWERQYSYGDGQRSMFKDIKKFRKDIIRENCINKVRLLEIHTCGDCPDLGFNEKDNIYFCLANECLIVNSYFTIPNFCPLTVAKNNDGSEKLYNVSNESSIFIENIEREQKQ